MKTLFRTVHTIRCTVAGISRSLPLLLVIALPLCAGDAMADNLEDKPGTSLLDPTDVRSLLSWASHLSRYAPSAELPEVRLEPAAFFRSNACGGRPGPCRVLGWYADRGVIHIAERLGDLDSLFARSLVVHELVHFLQHRSGRFATGSCVSFVEREREAYAVQQGYFVAHGSLPAILPHRFACPHEDDALAFVLSPGL